MPNRKATAQLVNSEQLFQLSGGVQPPPAVRLDDLLSIPPDERITWERRLNRYLNSCGCAEGAVGLFVGIGVVLILYLAHSEPWTAWQITAVVALPFALLVAGKLTGRWLDRLRFRKVCKDLLSRLAA